MKIKYSALALASLALGLGFTACDDDDYNDWANPTSVTEADDATVSFSATAADAIYFSEIADSVTTVKLFTPTLSTNDASATTTYKVVLSNDGASTTVDTVDVNGYASLTQFQSAVIELYGRAPELREIAAQVIATTSFSGAAVNKTADITISAQLVAPEISEAYYIIGGAESSWSTSAVTAFSRSDESVSVYDDPVFTVTFAAYSEDDCWFAIVDDKAIDAIDNSSDWSYVIGTTSGNGNNGESGSLARRSELSDDGSFEVKGAKYITVTINMLEYTYTVESRSFSDYLYIIGDNINGDSWTTSFPLYSATGDGNYKGYYYINGAFKFKPNADNWDGDYEYESEGKFSDNGGSNLPAPDPSGFYMVEVDLANYTYTLTQVEYISIIGTVVSGTNWDTYTELTYDSATNTWSYTGDFVAGEFKFLMNHDWDVASWGGELTNLTEYNGGNLKSIAEAGTYTVTLSLSYEGNNSATVVKSE